MRSPAILCLLACACAYQPGTLRPAGDTSGITRQLGCLDLVLERVPDPAAVGPAVRIAFANRCDRAARVDLGALDVFARFRDQTQGRMRVYDPDLAIRPGLLDARATGWEVLEYHLDDPAHSGKVADALCFDLAPMAALPASTQPVIACLSLGGEVLTTPDGSPDTTSPDTTSPDTTSPDTTSPDTTSPDTTSLDTTTLDTAPDDDRLGEEQP